MEINEITNAEIIFYRNYIQVIINKCKPIKDKNKKLIK